MFVFDDFHETSILYGLRERNIISRIILFKIFFARSRLRYDVSGFEISGVESVTVCNSCCCILFVNAPFVNAPFV